MATKFVGSENAKRQDVFCIDPYKVTVEETLRGRHRPPSDEAIHDMALSIMDHGQQQAVQCRKLSPSGKLQLVLGFTRTAAVRLIRDGFDVEIDGESVHRQDKNALLKVTVVDCNDPEAFIRNVVENAHRNETSPIDDAFNQRRLREQYGMADAEIAKLYRYNSGASKVSRLKGLLDLAPEHQELVHTGKMPVDSALELRKLPEAERNGVVTAATEGSTKVNSAIVRKVIREKVLRDDPADEPSSNGEHVGPAIKAPPTAKPLTVGEIRGFWEGVRDDEGEDFSDEEKKFARTVIEWMAGRRTEKTLYAALAKLSAK